MNRTLAQTLLHVALLAGVVLTLTPMLWMLSASFMSLGEASVFPPRFLPEHPTLEHYARLFTQLHIGRYFLNSAITSVLVTVIALLVNSMAGYAFAKLRFPGRDRFFRALLAAMVVPAQVTMLPLFLMMKNLGFVNSYVGILIPGLASVFGIFLIRQFTMSIPDSLIEAARIDGASEIRIYRELILPLLRPILVTLGLFTFISTWNDFLWPLIIMKDDSMYTLPVALANLSGEHEQDAELMMAGSVITILPVMLIFLLFQKEYVRGIMIGGVKE